MQAKFASKKRIPAVTPDMQQTEIEANCPALLSHLSHKKPGMGKRQAIPVINRIPACFNSWHKRGTFLGMTEKR
ncbi:MAG: hypothetical protein PHD82_14315, partial [Candidatus Riflebacteria bacterium]|nr:hypothetical protein [Candidatus Riflebacteria bacterium]